MKSTISIVLRVMGYVLFVVALCMILLTTGCKTVEPPPPIVLTQWVFADCGVEPERSSVQLKPLSWQVSDGRFSLSPQGYQDLSYNVTVALVAIKEYEVVLTYYQACLDDNAAKAAAVDAEKRP